MIQRTHDAGAQNERTSLAWTRTGLALLVASLLAGRFAAARLGPVAVVAGAIAAGTVVAVLYLARRRYRVGHAALHGGAPLPDGRLPALVTIVVTLLAVLELGYAVAR
ncbi:MAG TPA: DUF202 domain-containing protein [Jiangellaceae bacterium]